MITDERMRAFVRESNLIEDIRREPIQSEIEAHWKLVSMKDVAIADLIEFVSVIQPGAKFRDRPGRNVRIIGAKHQPSPGGPEIRLRLNDLLRDIRWGRLSAYDAHCRYEYLHPFQDGNGRSGRALWLHGMLAKDQRAIDNIGFLHWWYYQSLDAHRRG